MREALKQRQFNFAVFLICVVSALPALAQTTYDLLVQGKTCAKWGRQQLDCNYKIGDDFWLSIAAVGSGDAGTTFMKSDFNGKCYGTVGVSHGCAIVKTGMADQSSDPLDLAFVSPKNGKVYRDWPSCKEAR